MGIRRIILALLLLSPVACQRLWSTQSSTSRSFLECQALEQTAAEYVDANRTCQTDADCVSVGSRGCHQIYALSTRTGNEATATQMVENARFCHATLHSECYPAWEEGESCGGVDPEERDQTMCTMSFNYIPKACVNNRCQDNGDGYGGSNW